MNPALPWMLVLFGLAAIWYVLFGYKEHKKLYKK